MKPLPVQTQTVFAELGDRVRAREASRTIAHLPGFFASKTVRGRTYWYFKTSLPGTGQHEYYVGPETESVLSLIENHKQARPVEAAEDSEIARLCAMLRAGGANLTDGAASRVLRALADAGVFRLGGMLVGTYAFVVLGNTLGVRWTRGSRTQDIDIAAGRSMAVALPPLTTDVPSVLEGLEIGFLPVPGLDPREPTTSFKVRGKELRVDFLTPKAAGRGRVVRIPRFNLAATSLDHLDYLLERPVSSVSVDGGAVLVNVPDPARFALHKLVVAELRPVAFAAKAGKDRDQARELLEVLVAERPGDVEEALRALREGHAGLLPKLRKSVSRLPGLPLRKLLSKATDG